jgi:hypothetical protein
MTLLPPDYAGLGPCGLRFFSRGRKVRMNITRLDNAPESAYPSSRLSSDVPNVVVSPLRTPTSGGFFLPRFKPRRPPIERRDEEPLHELAGGDARGFRLDLNAPFDAAWGVARSAQRSLARRHRSGHTAPS